VDDTTSTVANESGPSGWIGAVAEVDSRGRGVDVGDCAEEVTSGDTMLFDEPTPWLVGDVHATSSMTMAVPHITRRSATFWRLPSELSTPAVRTEMIQE